MGGYMPQSACREHTCMYTHTHSPYLFKALNPPLGVGLRDELARGQREGALRATWAASPGACHDAIEYLHRMTSNVSSWVGQPNSMGRAGQPEVLADETVLVAN